MIVNNGAKWLSQGSSLNYKEKNGNTSNYDISMNRVQTNCFVDNGGGNYGCVMNLGSGDTAAAKSDYWLDTALTSDDYECLSGTGPVGQSDGQIVYTFTFRAKRAITIREICISSLYTNKVMMARSVIPERAVESDETFSFSYAIKFN